MKTFILCLFSTTCYLFLHTSNAFSDEKPKVKILFIGAKPDHPHGSHMYMHTCGVLAKCAELTPGVETVVSNGWPKDAKKLEGVKTIVVYSGPAAELLLEGAHRGEVADLMKKGVGLVTIHWASSVNQRNFDRLGPTWLSYTGGTWVSNVGLGGGKSPLKHLLPMHPICRGWQEYEINDEFYLNPFIKQAKPLLQVQNRKKVKDTIVETDVIVGWVYERPDGGRAFGTTLGHPYANFRIEAFRRMIVNGILWTAHVEVPAAGAPVALAEKDLALPPADGAKQPKPSLPGEPKLSVLQEITKDEKLPELEVVGDFLLKEDLMLVNSIFSSKIVAFQRAKEDGKLKVLGTIDAHEPLWKQSPTIRGQHTFMHMVFGGNNTIYLTGSTFHATGNGRSMGMVWYKVDFKTGKAELLGAQKCPVGNLVMSNDNKSLYLLTQFPPGISRYRIDEKGTPVHAENVTGKGLGSTGVMEGKTREGTTSGSLSPDGKFLYNFNDKERAVGPWSFQAEYFGSWVSNSQVPAFTGPKVGTTFTQSAYVEALYFLTGENRPWIKTPKMASGSAPGRIIPFKNFYSVPGEGGRHLFSSGAWQVGARFSWIDLNNQAQQTGSAYDVTLVLNWFLNPNMKFQWNYDYVFRDALATSSGPINGVGFRFAMDF